MEELAVKVMAQGTDPLKAIKRIIDNSHLRGAQKTEYAIKLINIARSHNLI